jgi:Skp family chaperone for outer membrane proteins
MISKISLGLGVFLAAAVVYLFSQQGSQEMTEPRAESTEASIDAGITSDVLAFIREDSILVNYTFVTEEGKRLESKLEAKNKRLNQEMANYQQEAAKWEEYLQRDQSQQTYDMAMQDMTKREAKLAEMQAELENVQVEYTVVLTNKVQDCVTQYAQDNGIAMVVYQAQQGSPILYGSTGIDITDQITAILNEEYAQEKALEEGEE